MSEGTRVLVGLGVGLGAGLAIAASNDPALLRAADWVTPIGTLWVNAIRMTVIPLVVSLVITGVASASNVGAVGRIGRRTIVVFIAMLTGAVLTGVYVYKRNLWITITVHFLGDFIPNIIVPLFAAKQ